MDDDEKKFIKIIGVIILFLIFLITITADYSTTEAQVKVQEVGTRYAFLNLGEQQFIRVQNAYSNDYSASSESWETCIDYRDMETFKKAKNSKTIINIVVKGYGLSTKFTCINGDRVIEILP